VPISTQNPTSLFTGAPVFNPLPTPAPTTLSGAPVFTPPSTSAPSTLATSLLTASPSAGPSLCSIGPTTERYDELVNILTPDVTALADLEEVGSSANLALNWLVDENRCIQPQEWKVIQRYIVGKIYFQMHGDSWLECSRPDTSVDSNPTCDKWDWPDGLPWMDVVDECEWAFIRCRSDGRITDIEIRENAVTGTLVDEIDHLPLLQVFMMDGKPNHIEGTIPTQFGNLTDLRILDMDENGLVGSIPEEVFSTAKGLEQLDLDTNSLTGTISTLLGTLPKLMLLQLYSNPIQGTFPSEELAKLPVLEAVGLFDMDLTGIVSVDVCARRTPSGSLQFLWTDCGGSEPQVICDCCDFCFS